jgi:hypothetical protein
MAPHKVSPKAFAHAKALVCHPAIVAALLLSAHGRIDESGWSFLEDRRPVIEEMTPPGLTCFICPTFNIKYSTKIAERQIGQGLLCLFLKSPISMLFRRC